MKNRKGDTEWLPWYRAHGFKGDVTETEKRQLDAFRLQPKHPAATTADLPEEARSYISALEMNLLDKTRESAFGISFFWTTLVAAPLVTEYFGRTNPELWQYIAGGSVIILAWINYGIQSRKITQELFPSGKTAPRGTDEALRREWEFEYLSTLRRQERN